ncbi:hypothetical protein [Microbacterium sp. CGR1]|uniref:hypothetical protein n=1 Tax=Microbacterium sp. CGR1 TaxID=1696072 RepID=UPI003DA386AE
MARKTIAQLKAREAALLDELDRRDPDRASKHHAAGILDADVIDGYDPNADTSKQQAAHLLGEDEGRG